MSTSAGPTKALEEAFSLFYEESKKLELQQSELQTQINLLSEELSESNQRITTLLNSMPAGVILLENQVVKIFNPAAMQFLPFLSSGQLFAIPQHWEASLSAGEYQIHESSANSSNNSSSNSSSNSYNTAASHSSDTSPNTSPVFSTQDSAHYNATSKTVQVLRIDDDFRSIIQIQDITENISMHQKSLHEARLASMGKMAAGIAHQFRTPLATALLYASHLCDQDLDAQTKVEFSERLRKQLLGLEKLSKEMLHFVTNRPRQTEMLNINVLLQEADQAIRPLCEDKGVALVCDFKGDNLMMTAEKSAIINSLIAILENALRVSEASQSILFSMRAEGPRCLITVQDQGPGISDSMLESLFEPFLTGHSTGTGLGLAIAKNAIEAHRGSIMGGNNQTGAYFTITLPIMRSF